MGADAFDAVLREACWAFPGVGFFSSVVPVAGAASFVGTVCSAAAAAVGIGDCCAFGATADPDSSVAPAFVTPGTPSADDLVSRVFGDAGAFAKY
jgi:hypothetical protein